MSKTNIHDPHYKVSKKSLSDITVAKKLLQTYLSPAIIQRIQWDSLRLSNKSFTNKKLAQLQCDLVYSCQIDNKSAYIYILLEEQTEPDPLLAFRFLRYNVALLAEHLAQNKQEAKRQHLPTILNLFFYTGEETPYPYSLDIYDYFEDPILARAEMFKPLSLIELGQIEDDELAKNGTKGLLKMLLMRSGGRIYLTSFIHYILSKEEKYSAEELIQAIVNIVPKRKEDIMNAAQQLEQRGELRGRQEEKLHIAKNMLYKLRLDMQTVAQATGLSEEELKELQKIGQ